MTPEEVLKKARQENRTVLTEVESKELLASSGIPIVPTRLARSGREAASLAQQVGFPVVLKITSPDIVHKSDIGGVRAGLKNAGQVQRAYREIIEMAKRSVPSARVQGVAVQHQAPPGTEVIIGAAKDPQFGHFLMFGLGGVLVEVLKDVSFRLVPLSRRDARQMIREIKAFPLLQGYRGQPPADVTALEGALLALSAFLEGHQEIKEVDLNPIFAYRDGILAVDARVILEEAAVAVRVGT